ncbi:MAG: hypothetical protein EOO43_17760 [Flavobacterium sp.]|nr:MAG: hypothetical protein EOO43_17760 [Flavobacterium sp.]
MDETLLELEGLFSEAKSTNEFEFILTLINFKGMDTKYDTLYEWFDAIEMYKELYFSFDGKKKTRMACLLYSTFFENSDFYNILGSLCNVSLGYHSSSYFFWKTKKQDRLLGTGEKINLVSEILNDCNKKNILQFFDNEHHAAIRNSFFHAAYSLTDNAYNLYDTEAIRIEGVGRYYFDVNEFLYPIVEKVIAFFDAFKKLFLGSFAAYTQDKTIKGYFPNLRDIEIKGGPDGLKGFVVKNTAQFYGEWSDSWILYDKNYDMWQAMNIRINLGDKEAIEIDERLTRYEKKPKINISDVEFNNLGDKIIDRNLDKEMRRLVELIIKFGDKKYEDWKAETNPFRKASLPKDILPFYQKADLINKHIDPKEIRARIKELTESLQKQ